MVTGPGFDSIEQLLARRTESEAELLMTHERFEPNPVPRKLMTASRRNA